MALSTLTYVIHALVVTAVTSTCQDAASNQLLTFKQETLGPIGILTTSAGKPINYEEATSTLNKILLDNEYFMESTTHVVRRKIPERYVHPKGTGAFGYFEVTNNITEFCIAKFLNKVGKRTRVAVRFSPGGLKGEPDTVRKIKGMGLKLYTEEGNFDLTCVNTPFFGLKDPLLFPSLTKVTSKNPVTELDDPNMFWDFLTLHPESLYMFMHIFGDRGIPDGYRHMSVYPIHTYQIVGQNGKIFFVRFHLHPDQGIKCLTSARAKEVGCDDPDYYTRDLYDAIANHRYPSWTVSIQLLSPEDVAYADVDVFDVTIALSVEKYPLIPLGKLVLNENPNNQFAQIEQLIFNPANLVRGILGSPDKLYESRRLTYREAQYYRLGTNYANIPVNCPFGFPLTYERDGSPPVGDNMRSAPNYYPNSFNGPVPYIEKDKIELIKIHEDPPNNFPQARNYYLNEMTSDERLRLVDNIAASLKQVATFLQVRALNAFALIHPQLSDRIRRALRLNTTNDCKEF